MSSLEDVLSEWQTNLAFKQEFKKNPEKALASAGLTLNPTDLQKVKSMLKINEDESSGSKSDELDKRINK